MNRFTIPVIGFAILMLFTAESTAGDVKLAPVFTDHMVLQQASTVMVWGTADPGANIRVEFAGQTQTAVTREDGNWSVELDPMSANSESRTLQVTSTQSDQPVSIDDVLVGEVWLASGQSNMEWEMQMKPDSAADLPKANHPLLRLFAVPLTTALTPQSTVDASWAVSSPESAASFSAVGYYFGLKLHQDLDVPVGIIQSAWGGTRIEPWTSLEGLDAIDGTREIATRVRPRVPGSESYRQTQQQHLEAVSRWVESAQAALGETKPVPSMPAQPEALALEPGSPTVLYNAMIHPLVPMSIAGAIWYQGESNHGEGLGYIAKQRALHESWRRAFKNDDLPFYFVQIAPYQYGDEDSEILPRFWVAQRECARDRDTGMAVISDIAEIGDIHPARKKEVARRLALHALANHVRGANLNGVKVDPDGPLLRSFEVAGDSIRVQFDHADSGLASRDGKPLTHFEVAGSDGVFKLASAEIEGNSVIVKSHEISAPRQVRFGWHKTAMPNLMDIDGLPAAAFHSHWPIDPELGQNFARDCSVVSSDPNVWGWATGLTDGSWETRAPHCFATGIATNFPKSVTIDLKATRSIDTIRFGTPDIGSTKTVAVAISEDGKSFHELGEHVFPLGEAHRETLSFAKSAARFIRLDYKDAYDQEVGGFDRKFGFTTEVEAYGSK